MNFLRKIATVLFILLGFSFCFAQESKGEKRFTLRPMVSTIFDSEITLKETAYYQNNPIGFIKVNNDVKGGFSVGGEFLYHIIPQLQIGSLGYFIFEREIENTSNSLKGWALFISGKYDFLLNNIVNIYGIARVGYESMRIYANEKEFEDNLKDQGLTTSYLGAFCMFLGGGLEYNSFSFGGFFAELGYTIQMTDFKYEASTIYEKLVVSGNNPYLRLNFGVFVKI
ncbi:hypothetical protein [Treponema sp. J25]|uniref:hypothetical protein n=1 Tax=Treponema sp. J25 TaxID=2094121 RepID=UPI0010473B24|nr:hypothetical protein [Treponema sp. J25]TCW62315.1 hypothetical protein C5O22_02270 [Treponema sp. J25]